MQKDGVGGGPPPPPLHHSLPGPGAEAGDSSTDTSAADTATSHHYHRSSPSRPPQQPPKTMEPRESGDDLEDPDPPRPAPRRSRLTARSILGVLTIMLSLALLGLGIKMSVKYDEVPLIHVSFAFVGFTASFPPFFALFTSPCLSPPDPQNPFAPNHPLTPPASPPQPLPGSSSSSSRSAPAATAAASTPAPTSPSTSCCASRASPRWATCASGSRRASGGSTSTCTASGRRTRRCIGLGLCWWRCRRGCCMSLPLPRNSSLF